MLCSLISWALLVKFLLGEWRMYGALGGDELSNDYTVKKPQKNQGRVFQVYNHAHSTFSLKVQKHMVNIRIANAWQGLLNTWLWYYTY